MPDVKYILSREFLELIKKTIIGVKNWHKLFLFKLGFYKSCDLEFSNLGNITFQKNDYPTPFFYVSCNAMLKPYRDKIMSIHHQKNNKIIDIDGFKFSNDSSSELICLLGETFIDEQYDFNLSGGGGRTFDNATVIDVGANIGDSTLYFANNGFNVVAFEPSKNTFNTLKKNLDLNESHNFNIIAFNKGVGCKNHQLKLFNSDNNSIGATAYSDNINIENYEIIDIVDIKEVINEYNNENNSLFLKMDCEGCEVDVILNRDLSVFEMIYFEHHKQFTNVSHSVLVEKLENQGFVLVNKDNTIRNIKSINKKIDVIKMIKKEYVKY
ncbi:MAG: FkbM family methyltransferase [Methanobrevibacter sp.]|jgi:FkbM family methyltransferase|nr:FkbM family methyltransferase [Candidatus Methanoflexus mossambicus]